MIILFQPLSAPLSFGPYGTAFLLLVTVVLAVISWRQRTWKSTADAAVAEMNVHKEANDRLRSEKEELHSRLSKLEAKTDLAPLIKAQETNAEIIRQWVTEGRHRFDEARNSLESNTKALTQILEESRAQRAASEDAYRTLSATFMTHALDDKEYQLRYLNMLDSVEKRLSSIAVKIGMDNWESPILRPRKENKSG